MTLRRILQFITKNLVLTVSALAGLLFAAIFITRLPATGSISDQTQEGLDRIDKMHRNSRAAATLDDDITKVEGYWTKAQASFIDPMAKAANLAYFYGTGARCDVIVTKVEQRTVGTENKPDEFAPVFFYLSADGSFPALMRFMDTLRKEHQIMRVDKCSIKPSNFATAQETLNLVIAFQTHTPDKEK